MEDTKFSRVCKELMEEELTEYFKENPNFVITNYFGLSSNDLNEFRKEMQKTDSAYFVVKNRAARRVLKSLKLDEVLDLIEGGTGLGFIKGDVVEAAKKVLDFSKKHESFTVKGGYIDGKKFDSNKLKDLAALPSKEVLLTMLVSTLNSPISGFVNVLGGVLRKFLYAINAIKEKKEKENK